LFQLRDRLANRHELDAIAPHQGPKIIDDHAHEIKEHRKVWRLVELKKKGFEL
jgi:hypothetical protein